MDVVRDFLISFFVDIAQMCRFASCTSACGREVLVWQNESWRLSEDWSCSMSLLDGVCGRSEKCLGSTGSTALR